MIGNIVNLNITDEFDVDISRSGKWGNPFSHLSYSKAEYIVSSRTKAIDCFRRWLLGDEEFEDFLPEKRKWMLNNLEFLRGKILGCHCYPKKCHGEVLIELLEPIPKEVDIDSCFGE